MSFVRFPQTINNFIYQNPIYEVNIKSFPGI